MDAAGEPFLQANVGYGTLSQGRSSIAVRCVRREPAHGRRRRRAFRSFACAGGCSGAAGRTYRYADAPYRAFHDSAWATTTTTTPRTSSADRTSRWRSPGVALHAGVAAGDERTAEGFWCSARWTPLYYDGPTGSTTSGRAHLWWGRGAHRDAASVRSRRPTTASGCIPSTARRPITGPRTCVSTCSFPSRGRLGVGTYGGVHPAQVLLRRSRRCAAAVSAAAGVPLVDVLTMAHRRPAVRAHDGVAIVRLVLAAARRRPPSRRIAARPGDFVLGVGGGYAATKTDCSNCGSSEDEGSDGDGATYDDAGVCPSPALAGELEGRRRCRGCRSRRPARTRECLLHGHRALPPLGRARVLLQRPASAWSR